MTQVVQFVAPSGLAGMTAKLFVPGADTVIASASATEAVHALGNFTATFNAVAAATYQLIVFSSNGYPVAQWFVDFTASGTFLTYDGLATVHGFDAAGLLAMRQNLTGAVVTVTGPVTYDPCDGLTVTLTIGDDYSAADSRAIVFDLDGTALPDLTTATVALVCEMSGRKQFQVVISGEITVPTGTTRTVRFQPAANDTAQLSPTVDGEFFTVITLASGRTITPLEARGKLVVLMGKRIGL
jgi:hypothetical protein